MSSPIIRDCEELPSAVTKVSDILADLMLNASSILDFVEKCSNVTE